jgi:GT2 family glycosyltransferase
VRTAVVVTTYNSPRFLSLCLRSLELQTDRDFDVLVADDGSGEPTAAAIRDARARGRLPGELRHFWHPDRGYRKARINNEVFAALGAHELVVCVDHDVILHRRFVEDHRAAHAGRPPGLFMGRRVELGPRLSREVSEDRLAGLSRGLGPRLAWSGLRGDTRRWLRAVRIGSPRLRRLLGRDRVPDLLGSNFSISRELLWRVNGYNEDFRSYWGEDGDLFVRVRNSGAPIAGSRSVALQFHLHHPRLEPDPASQARYAELLGDTTYVRCRNGIVRDAP